MFAAKTAAIVGNHDPSFWTQSFTTGNLFVVAQYSGEQAARIGTQFFKTLQEKPLTKITTLKDFKQLLVTSASEGMEYVAAFLYKESVFLIIHKTGSIWIKRGTKIAKLLEGDGSLTGRIQSQDVFLLVSGSTTKTIDPKTFSTLLRIDQMQSIAEQLTLEIHQIEPFPVASALVLQFSESIHTANKFRFRMPIPRSIRLLTPHGFKLKPAVLIIGLLVCLLLLSVVFGIRKKGVDAQVAAWQSVSAEVAHKYDEGIALVDLNPVRARELLGEAKHLLTTSQFTHASIQKQVSEQLAKIDEGLTFALRSYQVDFESFFDIDLIKAGGEAAHIALYTDVLVLTDERNESIYTISLTNKSSRILVGDSGLDDVVAVTLYGENIYVVTDEIKRVAQNKLNTLMPADSEWGRLTELAVFNENIYVLDSVKNQIWKYISTEDRFSEKQNYLLSDTLVDLSGATDLAIDGVVWVANKGSVLKFVQGRQETWSIKGLDEDLGDNVRIFTDEATTQLYIFDVTKKRVIVVDKEGIYLAQYRWTTEEPISDFVVSEQLKKILLLSRDTIYAIELK